MLFQSIVLAGVISLQSYALETWPPADPDLLSLDVTIEAQRFTISIRLACLIFFIFLLLCGCCTTDEESKKEQYSPDPITLPLSNSPSPRSATSSTDTSLSFVTAQENDDSKTESRQGSEGGEPLVEGVEIAEAETASRELLRKLEEETEELRRRYRALFSKFQVLQKFDTLSTLGDEDLTSWVNEFRSIFPPRIRQVVFPSSLPRPDLLEKAKSDLEDVRAMCERKEAELKRKDKTLLDLAYLINKKKERRRRERRNPNDRRNIPSEGKENVPERLHTQQRPTTQDSGPSSQAASRQQVDKATQTSSEDGSDDHINPTGQSSTELLKTIVELILARAADTRESYTQTYTDQAAESAECKDLRAQKDALEASAKSLALGQERLRVDRLIFGNDTQNLKKDKILFAAQKSGLQHRLEEEKTGLQHRHEEQISKLITEKTKLAHNLAITQGEMGQRKDKLKQWLATEEQNRLLRDKVEKHTQEIDALKVGISDCEVSKRKLMEEYIKKGSKKSVTFQDEVINQKEREIAEYKQELTNRLAKIVIDHAPRHGLNLLDGLTLEHYITGVQEILGRDAEIQSRAAQNQAETPPVPPCGENTYATHEEQYPSRGRGSDRARGTGNSDRGARGRGGSRGRGDGGRGRGGRERGGRSGHQPPNNRSQGNTQHPNRSYGSSGSDGEIG